MKFLATKKGMIRNFFSSLSLVAVFGSGIRDPGSGMGKNKKSRSAIRDKHPGPVTLVELEYGEERRGGSGEFYAPFLPGLEKTRVFLKKTSPVGFFGFFWVFFGFFGFFWVFLGFFAPSEGF